MEEVRSDLKEEKEVKKSFKEIIAEDETIKQLDELIKNANGVIARVQTEVIKTNSTIEDPDNLILQLADAEKEVVKGMMMHHHLVMALYAKYVGDNSPESAGKNLYW